jgi:hypothetical protein
MPLSITGLLSAFSTGVSAAKTGYQGWTWWLRWRRGTVEITSPGHMDNITIPTITVLGKSSNPTHKFWLVTVNPKTGERWLKTRIGFRPDGIWREEIGVGDRPGPREIVLVVAWTSPLVDAVFQDYKDRSKELNDWKRPFKLSLELPQSDFQVVQGIVLQVPKAGA